VLGVYFSISVVRSFAPLRPSSNFLIRKRKGKKQEQKINFFLTQTNHRQNKRTSDAAADDIPVSIPLTILTSLLLLRTMASLSLIEEKQRERK
jgi:hypothetical protein